MIETKIVKLQQEEFFREEAVINDYACFGWVLMHSSTAQRVVDGYSRDAERTLTFHRDSEIPNKEVLDQYFTKYCVAEGTIASAASEAKISKKTYWTGAIISALICGIICFGFVYPVMMDGFWNPNVGHILFAIVLNLIFTFCGVVLFSVVPLGIASGIKQKKAAQNASGTAYIKMREIAQEASQYLRKS